ncbi:MAG: hypothetical protein Q6373_016045 [Candidatus Sigynarchaeota archaeon]
MPSISNPGRSTIPSKFANFKKENFPTYYQTEITFAIQAGRLALDSEWHAWEQVWVPGGSPRVSAG